jgi:nicotinate dehydrogenase subunit B
MPDIASGRARYAADVRLPGMLRGHVLHPSFEQARLLRVGDVARQIPGVVRIVREGDFVGVVGERYEQALAAMRLLQAEWTPLEATAKPIDLVLRQDEGIDGASAGAAQVFKARDHIPHIAHASIGPTSAVPDIRTDGADLYVATQRPFALRDAVASLIRLSPESIRMHPQMMGACTRAATSATRRSKPRGCPHAVRPVPSEPLPADSRRRAARRARPIRGTDWLAL